MSDQPSGAEVGSLAEEAAKLLGALSGWAEEHLPDLEEISDQAGAVGHGVHEHLATGGPECTYCPVCRLIRALRGTSPEVRTHLTAAAGSLVQAVAAALATEPVDRGSGRGVEHIPVDEEWPDTDPEGRAP